MRRFIRTSSVALVGLAMLAGPLAPAALAVPRATQAPAPTGGGPNHDSWIVVLVPGSIPGGQAASLAHGAGGRVGHVYTYAFHGFQFRGSAAAAEALRHNPYVASVTPDHSVFLTESLPNGIERMAAFDNDAPSTDAYHQGFRGNGARIAIMDTGIDLDHLDLANAIDHDLGKNCVTPALQPNDGYGHGTHVAGTAAAPLNGVGVVGVAPEARLVAVKVFDDAGNSNESLVLCGFEHVLSLNADGDPSNDIDVLNMSFGEQRSWGDCATDPLHTAVCNAYAAGITMVAGAGNSAVDAGSFVPAAYSEVIGVSALADFDAARGGLAGCGVVPDLGWFDCDDTLAFFSNHGPSVDVMAPGVSVYSTYAGGGYSTKSGTSMATPHVSGVAALMMALSPAPSPSTVRTLLRQSGECPNGSESGADGSCSGQGTWPDDPDGVPEPMIHALRAARAVGGAPAPVVPGPPTLTSATGGNGSVALAWSPPASDGGSAITEYQIWRGTTSGLEELLTTIPSGTTYTDFGVTNGTTYYYQVRAVNAAGPGPLSNELSATPSAAPVPPGAPTLTSATGGDGSVALAWNPPASDGGSPITTYEVWRATTSGLEEHVASPGTGTTYTDFGVTNGTTYYYQVRAVNAAGPGPLSNELSATPQAPAPVAPGPPTLTSATGGNGSVALAWSPPASNGGSAITDYEIWRGTASGTELLLITIPSGTTYTDFTVTNGTTYYYQVAAVNGVGPGPRSNELSATPLASPPVTRTGGTASNFASATSTTGSVAFSLPAGSNRLVAMVSMYVSSASVSSVTWKPDPADVSQDQAFTFVGRQTGLGNGAMEIWELADPAPGVEGSAVAHVLSASTKRIMGVHALSGVGSVGVPVGASANSTAISVDVASEAGALVFDVLWGQNSTTSYTPGAGQTERWDTNTAGGLNNLRGAGSEEAGGGSVTMSWAAGSATFMALLGVSFNPDDGGPPPPVAPGPPTLTSATGGNGSVALAWSPPASNGGSAITDYEIWRGTASGTELLLITIPSGTTYTDFGVTNGTTYYYQVRALNAAGPGPLSNELSATPQAPPPVPPGAPTLTSATGGNGSVALAWNPPASDGGSPITTYEVWRATTSGLEEHVASPGTGTTYTDFGVTNGTTYYYQVRAVNAAGPGPLSNELSATPQAPAPVAPGPPTLTSATGGNGSVALAWSPPASNGGSPITTYEVWRATTSGLEEWLASPGTGTTYTDFGVTNGTTYYYQVAAVNAAGPGPLSNELSATPLASPPVTRTGGTVSNFASATSTTGSVAFTLPAGSNRLVAMVSIGSTSAQLTSVTWRPNAANPAQDQAFTFVGRQTAPSGGAVEVWTLANPTPSVSGSSVNHVMSASAKRVMGIHALGGAGSMGVPVAASTNGNSISVDVASQTGALVLDVVYGQNSTTSYTAGAGQTEHWDTNTVRSLNNLRGCGSAEAGAPMVTMSWTSAKTANMAMLAVSFTP